MIYNSKCQLRLPCVTELFPDLMSDAFDETDEPSCSMVDALRKQSLFVNKTASAYALDLLWELLREGKVGNQGVYFNLRSRTSDSIDFKVWPIQNPGKSRGPPRSRTSWNYKEIRACRHEKRGAFVRKKPPISHGLIPFFQRPAHGLLADGVYNLRLDERGWRR